MRMILYCFHQLLGQRQYVVLGAQYVVDGDAARDLLEVSEFNLQCQRAPFAPERYDTDGW